MNCARPIPVGQSTKHMNKGGCVADRGLWSLEWSAWWRWRIAWLREGAGGSFVCRHVVGALHTGLTLTPRLGLYTILLVAILYGVCHMKGSSRGGRILPSSRAIVLQQCGRCRRAGRMKGRLTSAHTARSKIISCEGQVKTGLHTGGGGLLL